MPDLQQECRVSRHKERQDNIVFPEETYQHDNHNYAHDGQHLIPLGFIFHFLAGKHLYEDGGTAGVPQNRPGDYRSLDQPFRTDDGL